MPCRARLKEEPRAGKYPRARARIEYGKLFVHRIDMSFESPKPSEVYLPIARRVVENQWFGGMMKGGAALLVSWGYSSGFQAQMWSELLRGYRFAVDISHLLR
jgi:hypothetical protein